MRHLLNENGIETEDMRYFVAMRQQVKRQKGIKGTRVSTWMASVKSHYLNEHVCIEHAKSAETQQTR